MNNIYLAFYKADSNTATIQDKLVKLLDGSKYSHVELAVENSDGSFQCYSSSARDKGVRTKLIDLRDGKWDLFLIPSDMVYKERIEKIHEEEKDCKYDYFGLIATKMELLKGSNNRWYCSEYCAYNLGLKNFCNMGVKSLYLWSTAHLKRADI